MIKKFFLSTLLVLGLTAAWGQAQDLYWDNPQVFARESSKFPQTLWTQNKGYVFWQEKRSQTGWPQTYISMAVRSEGETDWTLHRRVLGPFTQTGEDVSLYSPIIDRFGRLWLAVLSENKVVQIWLADSSGSSFQKVKTFTSKNDLLFPRLFLNTDGIPLLSVNQGDNDSFRISLARFDGRGWSDLALVTPEPEQRQNFQACLESSGKTLYLVYQSLLTGTRITYQIYLKKSNDQGLTWSDPIRLSDFSEDENFTANDFDNQRPQILVQSDRYFVTWERRSRNSQPTVTIATYSNQDKRLDVQMLGSGSYASGNPLLFTFQNKLYLTWHENRRDLYEQMLSSLNPATGWEEGNIISSYGGNNYFGHPVAIGKDLYFFWQNDFQNTTTLMLLQPDKHVDPPQIVPVNFYDSQVLNKKDLSISLNFPKDPAGIEGYSILWDQNPQGVPPAALQFEKNDKAPLFSPAVEGYWYVHVRDKDMAGNWSEPVTMKVFYKTTPPKPILFDLPKLDSQGFLNSNTFSLSWKPNSPDAKSYAWRLDALGAIPEDSSKIALPQTPLKPNTTDLSQGFNNLENGYYALTVAPYDEAGNQGQPYSYFFRLNKFRPYTQISYVDAHVDNLGRLSLSIGGRGFTSEGSINQIYLDKDAQSPWDYEIPASAFVVESDRLIDGILLDKVQEGTYRVGVEHSLRGKTFTGLILKVEPSGTVKIGDFRNLEHTEWTFFEGFKVYLSVTAVPVWFALLLLFCAIVFSGYRVLEYAREMSRTGRQVQLIFSDTYYRPEGAERKGPMKRHGLSLRIKFAVSILILTLAVILSLSITLGFFVIQNSKKNLGEGLSQRTEVLLESLATGAQTYLPTQNTLELSFLPGQISAMKDAVWTTITGPGTQGGKWGYSYVWATNDPNIAKKIDTPVLQPGVSFIDDPIEKDFDALRKRLNAKAAAQVSDLADRINELNKKAQPFALKTDAESQKIVAEYQSQITRLETQVNQRLTELGRVTQSYPPYNPEKLVGNRTHYTFYKPIIYRSSADKDYVRGLVRLEVTTDSILAQITAARDQLVLLTLIIALAALGMGLVGALILSAITINPIKKLVKGVEVIRDTEDKSLLENHVIQVKTKDEINDLAQAINQMTAGLVAAAEANKDLMFGKDLQKTFIPLDKDSKGRKHTTGAMMLPKTEVFGYYEGAKGVSGDYFDFRQLDNNEGINNASPWYGFIKCDVSGKGIPAALIMFQVATLVVKFFRNWRALKDSKKIILYETVAEINDLLESLGFRGRFAALNMGILNVLTGKIRLCHAGDNQIHTWKASTNQFTTITLHQAPATGQIADMFARGSYKDFDLTLEKGDTLFFYTDGIEEAKRFFRGDAYERIAFRDPKNLKTFAPIHESGVIDGEELGPERVQAILTAYNARGSFRLEKWHNPEKDRIADFDFSDTDGSARGAILALVSVEKVFRLIPDPKATKDDKVRVDVQIDDFLKKHFMQYAQYFRDPANDPQYEEYRWFSYLKEDDQFDDLTLLAIKKVEA